MAEADRLAAALSYGEDRPAFGNPSMLEQGRKMRERKQAEQVDRSAQNVKSDLLARALMYRYNPETLTGLTDTPGPQTLDEAAGLDSRVDRSTFLPYSKKEGLHVPAVAADLMKLATASNPQYSNLMQPEEAMPLATNMMGGGVVASRLAPAPAGSLGMNVTSKRAFTAPQDEALRLAQQRAALPVEQHGLGLPADNTPQQRAAAMGFDIDAYKGMYPYDVGSSPSFGFKNGKFQQLDKFGEELLPVTEMVPELMSKMELGGKHAGFYGGKDVANRFAGYGTNSAVFPVKLNMGQNPLVKDASGQYAGRYQFERPARDAGMLDDYRDFTGAFFRDSPSTGAILKNTTDEGTIFIPRSGEQVRSRFAVFDPFRRNAALAAALGVAAPDLLAEENK